MQKSKRQIKLSVLMEKLCDLGWDYTAGRMSRSGMEVYDDIMQFKTMHLFINASIIHS